MLFSIAVVIGALAHPVVNSVGAPFHVAMPAAAPAATTGDPHHSPPSLSPYPPPLTPSQQPSLCKAGMPLMLQLLHIRYSIHALQCVLSQANSGAHSSREDSNCKCFTTEGLTATEPVESELPADTLTLTHQIWDNRS